MATENAEHEAAAFSTQNPWEQGYAHGHTAGQGEARLLPPVPQHPVGLAIPRLLGVGYFPTSLSPWCPFAYLTSFSQDHE